jgi:hypothetical protein
MAIDVNKVKGALDTGVAASKDALLKAGAAVRDLGDKGVTKLEVVQLSRSLAKTYEDLGKRTVDYFAGHQGETLKAEEPFLTGFLIEAERLKSEIETRSKASAIGA